MNMKMSYRAELRALNCAERKIEREHRRACRDCEREVGRLTRSLRKGELAKGRALKHIERRRAILEGRLSS